MRNRRPASTAFNDIAAGKVLTDIIFLDVDMPEITGMELVDLVKPFAEVIFITGHPQYSLDAFDKDVADFLLKPVAYDRFLKAIQRANVRLLQKHNSFFVKVNSKTQKLNKNEIIYVESKRNSVRFFLRGGAVIETLGTMEEILHSLGLHDFMRVHQSFIINLATIVSMEGNVLTLEEKKEVPIPSQIDQRKMAGSL